MSEDWKSREPDRDNLERHLDYELKKRGMTRRELVKGGAAMAGALGLGALFAACGGGDSGGEATTAAGGGETAGGPPLRRPPRQPRRSRARSASPASAST